MNSSRAFPGRIKNALSSLLKKGGQSDSSLPTRAEPGNKVQVVIATGYLTYEHTTYIFCFVSTSVFGAHSISPATKGSVHSTHSVLLSGTVQ